MEKFVRIRDRFQFDVELSYPLPADATRVDYELEAYFFLPPSLGINRDNYNKTNFYDDLDAYLQLRTPTVVLDELVPMASGPLSRLNASVFRLSEHADLATVENFVVQVKLFCCVVRKSLRKYVDAANAASDPAGRDRLCERYIVSVSSIRRAYRGLKQRLRGAAMYPQVADTYRFADEYLSLLFSDYTYRLLEGSSEKDPERRSRSETRLLSVVRAEVNYRSQCGYPSIAVQGSENESLLYRRDVLKRYVGSVLKLDTQTQPGGKFVQETVFGLAAGLSMLFATAILFVYQAVYGALSLPVFFALIISYVFKDRIKELLRMYFSRKLSGVLSDHKTRIFGALGECLGVCEETFDYISEAKLPADVVAVRVRDRRTEIEGAWVGERVMRYRRRIRLHAERIAQLYENLEITEIDDILRLNVTDLVKRTGTPAKPVFVLTEDWYQKSVGDRVHHLNLVIRHPGNPDTDARRFRVVLNQRGIKRIEAVSEVGRIPVGIPKAAAV